MRIFIVSGGYPTNKYLGTGIFEFDQAKALASIGHEVIFLSIDLRSIRRWRKWGRESLVKEEIPIEGVNIPLGRVPEWLLRMFGVWGLKMVYKVAVKKYGTPDIIHPHFTGEAYNSVKALKKYNVPIVMTEHSSAINKDNIESNLKKVAQYTYNQVDEIIVVSPTLQGRLRNSFGVNSTYIPNIIDLSIFSLETKNSLDENGFRIVSVGNLIQLKRMDRLIKAFSEFSSQHKNCKLEIFGDGPETSNLRSLIEERKLTSSVTLHGSKNREEIAKALSRASLFVLASSSETFGVAYAEALACGVPVIATRCGGPEGFVHEGNGLLIPVDDEEALVQALETMYNTVDSYDRDKIAAEAKKMFSPEVVAKQIEQVYKQVL